MAHLHVWERAAQRALVCALALDPLVEAVAVEDVFARQLDAFAARQALRRVIIRAPSTRSRLLADVAVALAEARVKGVLALLEAQLTGVAVLVRAAALANPVSFSIACATCTARTGSRNPCRSARCSPGC